MVEAIAQWEFGGNGEDLLAFKTGDLIKVWKYFKLDEFFFISQIFV